MEYFKAFVTGGIICAIGQILMDRTKLLPAKIVVLYVCTGAILSAVGIYEYIADFGGAGASVPLLGFGHILGSGVIREIDEVGFMGIFTGGLKASAAGICASVVFGYFASILFQSKGE